MAQSTQPRALLGVATSDVPPNVPVRGAWVHQVAPGSAASTAGVRPNDIIVAVDDRAVTSASALTSDITGRDAGETITLRILRPTQGSADRLTLTVLLGGTPAPSARPASQAPAEPTASARPAPAQATPSGPVTWTRFADPNEQAFTTEVPRGWRVAGGLVRHTPVDPSEVLRILSPDRRTYLMVGDPALTLFTTPLQSGLPQFAPTPPTIRPYLSGAAFARVYVAHAIPAVCGNLSIVSQQDRPDLAQGAARRDNQQAHHDGGEVTFTCVLGGAQARGMVAAATFIYPTPGNVGANLWSADLLAGFIAAPDGYDAAEALVRHVVEAMQFSPAWVQRQQVLTQQTANAINAQTQQNIRGNEQFLANARAREHQMDQQVEQFDRILTGTSPYAGPDGTVHQLDNTQTQWVNPNGRIVGTGGASPGPAWQQLKEVPPE